MKILQAPEDKWEELSNNLIVICGYQTKQGETVFGIDTMYENQYPDFVEVEVLNPNAIWHEEHKPIQLVQSQEGFNWTAINFTELAEYRKTMNIATYQHDGKFYYYLHFIENVHRTIFENKEDEHGNKLPGFYIDIEINEK